MRNLIKIKANQNNKIDKKITNYLVPELIYIPCNDEASIHVKTGDVILKNDKVLTRGEKKFYTPVSGKVLGLCDMFVRNVKTKCVVIENDFKEKSVQIKIAKKNLSNYPKEDILSLISKYGFNDYNLDGKIMIINGLDMEPNIYTRSTIINEYINELLDTVDALCNIFTYEKCYFTIKNNDSANVEKLLNQIGTYPNIEMKMIPDLYPIARKDILIKEILSHKEINEKLIYLTVEEIYEIYHILKRNRSLTEKIITVNCDIINQSKLLNVKYGTSIKDIINNNFKIKNSEYLVVINGLVAGDIAKTEDMIITEDINSIFITSPVTTRSKRCINCGMCHTKCPAGCDPRKNYRMDNCINCGTCLYICPAKIDFK